MPRLKRKTLEMKAKEKRIARRNETYEDRVRRYERDRQLRKRRALLKEAASQRSRLDDAATSRDNQDLVTPDFLSTDLEPFSSTRISDTDITIKEEEVKQEELILEDSVLSNEPYEPDRYEKIGSNKKAPESTSNVHSSTTVPFETVMCDVTPVKIKEEIIEDEIIDYQDSLQTDAIPTTSESTDMFASEVDQASIESLHSSASPIVASSVALTTLINKVATSGTKQYVKRLQKVAINRTENRKKNVVEFKLEHCHICNKLFSSRGELVGHYAANHSDDRSCGPFSPRPVSAALQLGHSVTNTPVLSAATITGQNVTNTQINSTTTIPGHSVINKPFRSASVANTPVHSAGNPPGQPPHDSPPLHISDCDAIEGVYVSLKNIPLERREKTKKKIFRLVKLISDLGVDPDQVCFSAVTTLGQREFF